MSCTLSSITQNMTSNCWTVYGIMNLQLTVCCKILLNVLLTTLGNLYIMPIMYVAQQKFGSAKKKGGGLFKACANLSTEVLFMIYFVRSYFHH